MRPLQIVNLCFFLLHWGGLSSIKPYLVHVFQNFGLGEAASWTTVRKPKYRVLLDKVTIVLFLPPVSTGVRILCAECSETSAHKIKKVMVHQFNFSATLMKPGRLMQFPSPLLPNTGFKLQIPAYCFRGNGLADFDSGCVRRPTGTRHYP